MGFFDVGKKGSMTHVVWVGLLIGIIYLGIEFGFLHAFGVDVSGRGPLEQCRISVATAARYKTLGKPLTGLQCKTQLVDSAAETKEEVLGEIARRVKDCWYAYNEGKSEFLSDIDFGLGDMRCFVCHELRFTDYRGQLAPEELLATFATKKVGKQTVFQYVFGEDVADIRVKKTDRVLDIQEDALVYITYMASKQNLADAKTFSTWLAGRALDIISPYKGGQLNTFSVLSGEGVVEACDAWK